MAWIDMKANWVNFFRQCAGLHKVYPVKVKRSELAKEFPLIQIKKDGDVGYDLYSTHEVVVPAMTPQIRAQYMDIVHERDFRIAKAKELGLVGAVEAFNEEYSKQLMDLLPRAVVPTGVFLEMGNSIWCSIEARSSSSTKLLITPDAIIDSGYRGELFGVVFNLGVEDYIVTKGERVVQAIFHERITATVTEVNKLGASERGETGFGSSGL